MAETISIENIVNGALGEGYMTINGKRNNMGNFRNFEASMDIKTQTVHLLGKVAEDEKPVGASYSFTANMYYNQSALREAAYIFKATGKMPTIEFQITNNDTGAAGIGSQTVILKGVRINSFTLAKFDVDSSVLDEPVNGTFSDWEMPEQFNALSSLQG